MDEQRFDQIAKRLGTARTRRATLKGLGVALLGAAGLATGLEAAAKGKGKRHGTSGRQDRVCSPSGAACSVLQPCCPGLDCNHVLPFPGGDGGGTCGCHLGACQHNTDCNCTDVTTCGTFGDTNGQCCRTKIGIYCNAPSETGSGCCGPAYVCASPGVFPPPANGGCQCNTAAGFVENNGKCICPAGNHVTDDGKCVPDETCVALGKTCNACHQCCAADGSVCSDPNHACNGSGGVCQCPSGTHESDGKCVPDGTCIQPGQTCNECHQCCEGSTCTDPNHACNGSGGTCCLNNGQPSQHQELCCSGCVVGGHCAEASQCQQPQCEAPLIPCGTDCINPNNQCCADEEIGVLCPPDPRGQRKCCPAGHTCNRNKNGTYNCGLGHGVSSRQGRGRKQR